MKPKNRLPDWMETAAKTLPTTRGIIVLRRVILGSASVGEVWQDGSLVWLTVHPAIYFVLGWFVFK